MSYIVSLFWEKYQVIPSKRSYYRFPRYLVKNIVIAFMKSFWKDRDIYCLSCIAWKYCNIILKLSCRALRCIWLRLFILMKHIDSREGSVFEEALQMKPIKSRKSEGNILNTPPSLLRADALEKALIWRIYVRNIQGRGCRGNYGNTNRRRPGWCKAA